MSAASETSAVPVTLDIRDGVAHLALNRPDAGNAINLALARALLDAARTCRDSDVRAVLLTGAGKYFCVGGDLREFGSVPVDRRGEHIAKAAEALHDALRVLTALDAPTVAAAHGAVAGAGIGLLAAADLALVAPEVSFTLAYTGIGYTPDGGITWLLPRLLGTRRALDLLLTNRRLEAAEAAQIGLVTRVVPAEELDSQARDLAETLAAGPTPVFGATKRLVVEGLTADLSSHLDRETRSVAAAATAAEGVEGVAAFLEKRPPRFRVDPEGAEHA